MKALFLAPHGDEAHIAAGGTIARLLEAHADVYVMAFTNADVSLPSGHPAGSVYQELRAAAAELGILKENVVLEDYPTRQLPEKRQEILQKLVDWRGAHRPDVVMAPSPADLHQDHAAVAAEALRAFRKAADVYGYDMPWNALGAAPLDLYVELSEAQLAAKMRALVHFKSQQGKRNNCATPEYARSLAVVRGNAIEAPYAEAFEVVREVRRVGRGLFG